MAPNGYESYNSLRNLTTKALLVKGEGQCRRIYHTRRDLEKIRQVLMMLGVEDLSGLEEYGTDIPQDIPFEDGVVILTGNAALKAKIEAMILQYKQGA